MPPTLYSDINWQELWQSARQQKSWRSKSAADWDKKAPGFARRNQRSPFVDLVINRLPLSEATTVLDVGCGPGTLALPLANRVRSVTALDYSGGMLDLLAEECRSLEIGNIRRVQGSWEDDWQQLGIGRHDLVIASRSMGVDDLNAALHKLDQMAARHVFIIDRIAPTPFDPAAFAAIGRDFESGPDYIYTVNALYSMGIVAHVDILALEPELHFSDLEQALDSYRWMIKEMSAKEEALLTTYLESRITYHDDQSITLRREQPPRWAMIWWTKQDDHGSV